MSGDAFRLPYYIAIYKIYIIYYYATNRQVAIWIPDGVIGIFQ